MSARTSGRHFGLRGEPPAMDGGPDPLTRQVAGDRRQGAGCAPIAVDARGASAAAGDDGAEARHVPDHGGPAVDRVPGEQGPVGR